MRRASRGIGVATIALSLVLAGRAAAQKPPSPGDKVAAEVLFNEGKALLGKGSVAEACPKLAESLRLDSGIGTMLYLADCWERSGKPASAWAQFREAQAVAANGKDPREKTAKARADKLEPTLSRLTIVVPAEGDLPGLVVTRDGAPVARPLWGVEVPVDPGKHVVRATAPKRTAWETTIDVATQGAHDRALVPVLAVAELHDPPAGAATAPPPAEPWATPAMVEPSGLGTQRILALGVGGAGILGLGLGTLFGLRAKSSISDAEPHCAGRLCDPEGLSSHDDAKSQALVSTIAFAAGGAAIVGAAVLWFTAPSRSSTSGMVVVPGVTPSSASLSAAGRF
jgi:hypothetical protein